MTRRPLTPILLLPASLLAQQHRCTSRWPTPSALPYKTTLNTRPRNTLAAAAHQQPAQYRAAELPNWRPLTGVAPITAPASPRARSTILSVYSRAAAGIIASQLITDFGRTHNLVGMSNLQAQAQDQASEYTRADVLLAATRAYFDLLRAKPYSRSLSRPSPRGSWFPIESPPWRRANCDRTRRHLRQRQSLRREAPSTASGKRNQFRRSRTRRRARVAQPDHVRCRR